MNTNTILLNNGVEMPLVGLGTYNIPVESINNIIGAAYELGYRKFDTAWLYDNEQYIGKAITDCCIPRDKIFITTKLHINNLYLFPYRFYKIRKQSVESAFYKHLKRLKTDYIDLFLIHWPFPNYLFLYEEIEKLYNKGLVRAIGVSSWQKPHLEKLKVCSDITPQVNQFEINPRMFDKDLIDYCKSNGILPESYSSFGSQNAKEILATPILKEIAAKYNKSTAQVILRFMLQNGISVIPRSADVKHLASNLSIFDFELSDEDCNLIKSLNTNTYSRFNPKTSLAWV